MKYTSPLRNNNPYWIPIVCKNRDYLIGYLNGVKLVEFTLMDILKQSKLDFNFNNLELFLDSSRFNDVMEDGRRERDLDEEEKKKIFMNIFKKTINIISNEHPENDIEYEDVLKVECVCGFGYYAWTEFEDIPTEQFKCSDCGRVIIDYTGNDDFNFEFDGGENENQQKA